jgi:hypothetical protein
MRAAAAFLGVLELGDFAIAFPLSSGRIQRCAEGTAPDESESYLNLRKLNASVFRLFREDATPFAPGRRSSDAENL